MKTWILILWVVISCSNPRELKLELLNDSIAAYSHNRKDLVNIVRYKITNPTDEIFYFNNMVETYPENGLNGVYKQGRLIRIFDEKNVEVKYKTIVPRITPEDFPLSYIEDMRRHSRNLGYEHEVIPRFIISEGGYENFFIHPDETLYFEYYINISDTINPHEEFRHGYPELKPNINYKAFLSIASDTTKHRENLPREILKTIKANNAKIYHGVLTSQSVPLKVLE